MTMLEVNGLTASYGQHPALQNVSLTVSSGEIVVILGANGAGKTSLLRAIAGICEGDVSGTVSLEGEPLQGLESDRIVEHGVALVPEGRGIFGDLTVKENLILGAYTKRARDRESENLRMVLSLFPTLQERHGQVVRTMSGGEQQMVAIGRALMSAPLILMLDEPSLGLSPHLCKELFRCLVEVRRSGVGILLVEQNAKQSLAIADRGYLLENSRIVREDSAENLASNPAVQKAYLGAGTQPVKHTSQPTLADLDEKVPSTSDPVARPLPRRTADQQLGLSIKGLVEKAARQAVIATADRTGAKLSSPPRDSQLKAVLQDIERAAVDARKRAAVGIGPKPDPVDDSSANNRDRRPPVIEIYRRPRVEVYRRRPDGTYKRD